MNVYILPSKESNDKGTLQCVPITSPYDVDQYVYQQHHYYYCWISPTVLQQYSEVGII